MRLERIHRNQNDKNVNRHIQINQSAKLEQLMNQIEEKEKTLFLLNVEISR